MLQLESWNSHTLSSFLQLSPSHGGLSIASHTIRTFKVLTQWPTLQDGLTQSFSYSPSKSASPQSSPSSGRFFSKKNSRKSCFWNHCPIGKYWRTSTSKPQLLRSPPPMAATTTSFPKPLLNLYVIIPFPSPLFSFYFFIMRNWEILLDLVVLVIWVFCFSLYLLIPSWVFWFFEYLILDPKSKNIDICQ